MKIEKAKQLTSRKFKRMTGVSRRTFELMVELVKGNDQKKKKLGRRPKLIIEDQVLMVIQYWREYRTYYHIGLDWGLSESAVCRTVYKIENILIKSRKFSLPGKKELWKMSSEDDLVVMDVTESPIEKPQKGQKRFFSGKQGEHTLKTQVIIHQKSTAIICLAHGLGRIHDFKLFKTSSVRFGELLKILAVEEGRRQRAEGKIAGGFKPTSNLIPPNYVLAGVLNPYSLRSWQRTGCRFLLPPALCLSR